MITKKIKGYRNILVVFLVSLFTLFVNPFVSLNVVAESESYGFENSVLTHQVTQGESGGWLTTWTNAPSTYVDNTRVRTGIKSYYFSTSAAAGESTFFNFTYSTSDLITNFNIALNVNLPSSPAGMYEWFFNTSDDEDIIRIFYQADSTTHAKFSYWSDTIDNWVALTGSDINESAWCWLNLSINANDSIDYEFYDGSDGDHYWANTSAPATVVDYPSPRIVYWNIIHPSNVGGNRELWVDDFSITTAEEFTAELIGNINISVFNESSPSTAIDDWRVDVLNSLGGVVYSLSNQSNPVEINHSCYGLGLRYFVISRENYSSRTYYTVVEDGWYYTLDALLPYEDASLLYYIKVINTFSQVVSNASITINKNIGGTLYNITSGHTDSNGYFACWLIPNATLYVDITILGDEWIPEYGCSGVSCPKTYVLNYTSGDTNITGYEFIHFEGSINSTGHITLFYRDSRGDTEDTNMTIFESWNGTLTKNISEGRINESIFTWVTSGYNTSRSHIAWLYVNHSEIWESPYFISITIYPLDYNVTDYWSIEDRFIDVFGDFDLGYVRTIFIFLPCLLFLVVFGSGHAGLGILSAGLWMGFVGMMISNIPNAANIVILAGILATMGVLVVVAKRGRDVI
jgi:hypothetical protein